eukprot:6731717-Prymnesium_polylepis.1
MQVPVGSGAHVSTRTWGVYVSCLLVLLRCKHYHTHLLASMRGQGRLGGMAMGRRPRVGGCEL